MYMYLIYVYTCMSILVCVCMCKAHSCVCGWVFLLHSHMSRRHDVLDVFNGSGTILIFMLSAVLYQYRLSALLYFSCSIVHWLEVLWEIYHFLAYNYRLLHIQAWTFSADLRKSANLFFQGRFICLQRGLGSAAKAGWIHNFLFPCLHILLLQWLSFKLT